MINKKFIVAAFLSAVLVIGNSVQAGSSDLLRMDLKKAAGDDSVDVTFYTTGSSQNTVVTRKSSNSYVVLLPNVSGNQSVVPSLGGVKDLVSNVTVKNVDDGIGGYTKVTFSTTKPVKFQTSTKKTAPLTKAQQDYKNLIAQNSKFDPNKKAENFKKVNNTVKAANAPAAKSANSSAVSKTVKPAINKTNDHQNKIALRPAVSIAPVKASKPAAVKSSAPKTSAVKPQVKQTAPKTITVKPKNNINIQNNTQINKNVEQTKPQVNPVQAVVPSVPAVVKTNSKPVQTQNSINKAAESSSKTTSNNNQLKANKERKGLPIFPILGALSVFGLFLLAAIFNVIARSAGKNSQKIKDFAQNNNSEQSENNKEYYEKLADDKKLSWQEKYKLYSEKQQDSAQDNKETSYIANTNNSKGAIVSNDLTSKVSQMEHALSQTPSMVQPKKVSKNVHSEEDAITNSMTNIKLKSFAKHIDLKETNRNTGFKTDRKVSEPLKEGSYVKLKPSALSMSRRDMPSSGFNISELLRKGRKYLQEHDNELQAVQNEEPYTISSMNEYLDILNAEETPSVSNTHEQISNLIPQRGRNMLGVTNPVQRTQIPFKTSEQTSEFGGIKVQSKYDIDSEKSIFAVESDGVSAIIGKIGENVFVLKKFDKIINKPLQVRLDYGNVYIVKMGSFKCLVDVSENKMGTLLEI